MNEEIEKLKRERDAAIEAGLKLADMTESLSGSDWTEFEDLVNKLKALRPEPEMLKFWVNVSNDESVHPIARIFIHETEDQARRNGGSKKARIAVPVIEVRPLPELPEMKEWTADNSSIYCDDGPLIAWAATPGNARMIIGRHNAAVRAFKAWAEAVKKEVGDE